MFGHHKDHPAALGAPKPSSAEVAHQFDQTNGVMKAFEDYQARLNGHPVAQPSEPTEQGAKPRPSMGYGRTTGGY
jgi:hypothetical protein